MAPSAAATGKHLRGLGGYRHHPHIRKGRRGRLEQKSKNGTETRFGKIRALSARARRAAHRQYRHCRVTLRREAAATAAAMAALTAAAVAGAAAARAIATRRLRGGLKGVIHAHRPSLPALASDRRTAAATSRATCARSRKVYSLTKRGQRQRMTNVLRHVGWATFPGRHCSTPSTSTRSSGRRERSWTTRAAWGQVNKRERGVSTQPSHYLTGRADSRPLGEFTSVL